jgi:NAD(P)-dependent dehydrogenase (short-subunit alcohol dehydrogenase family)
VQASVARQADVERKHFDVNVLGPLLASKEAVRHFGPAGGTIVNISSIASTLTPPNATVYNATKAAVDAVTRSLAKELGPVFLASDEAAWITGETLLVAGGLR